MMLDDKLNELKKLLMAEAGLVEKMLSLPFDGLRDRVSCLDEVMTFERRVNQLELEIENHCTAMIALFQPEAKDLRVILMSYKINNDLERLGDQAVNIAESAAALVSVPVMEWVPELLQMRDRTVDMLKYSIIAFTNEDELLSRQVCESDSEVDDYNRAITAHLIGLIKEKPQNIEEYLHILRISKNLERIADLSTNIAENTVYLAKGRVIKHHAEEGAEP
jgi:phosphate transport system protein